LKREKRRKDQLEIVVVLENTENNMDREFPTSPGCCNSNLDHMKTGKWLWDPLMAW